MKENKGMKYETMQNSTRFADTMAVLNGLSGSHKSGISRAVIYSTFADSGVPTKYAATALRLRGVKMPGRGQYDLAKMITGMNSKFGPTASAKKSSAKVKLAKVAKVKKVKAKKVEKPKVIKLQGVDHSAHSPIEEITDPNFGKIEHLTGAGLHATEDDITDELNLMGTYL